MRVIAIMAGGILFGPGWIVTGIVAGVHRYLIDIGGITSVPCLITSIIAGISAGYINLKVKKSSAGAPASSAACCANPSPCC